MNDEFKKKEKDLIGFSLREFKKFGKLIALIFLILIIFTPLILIIIKDEIRFTMWLKVQNDFIYLLILLFAIVGLTGLSNTQLPNIFFNLIESFKKKNIKIDKLDNKPNNENLP